jgi:hypothetical protein
MLLRALGILMISGMAIYALFYVACNAPMSAIPVVEVDE